MDFPWASTEPTAAASAQDALQQMNATIALASGLAASRRQVDLAGLDQAAGLLCARLLDLEPMQATALRPALMDLANRVTILTETLRDQVAARLQP